MYEVEVRLAELRFLNMLTAMPFATESMGLDSEVGFFRLCPVSFYVDPPFPPSCFLGLGAFRFSPVMRLRVSSFLDCTRYMHNDDT